MPEIIEADSEGGFDISSDPIPSLVPSKGYAPLVQNDDNFGTGHSFFASKNFLGAKLGFVFQTGLQGLGYYVDKYNGAFEKLITPPSDVNVSLVHHTGDSKPHLVEVCVGMSTGVAADDVKVKVTNNVCVLSSAKWTTSIQVPLKYPVTTAKAQGWMHQNALTVRFPIAAS
mmetsp:Transcript_49523/g.97901  ORF Transcript_49523/g.97901 Transcript_49523/m.97901 type:complete len:171 (-) Transcript_49523:78-590(-)